jgi:hypothetical protein
MKALNPNKDSPCPGCFRLAGCPLGPENPAPGGQRTRRGTVFLQAASALLPPVLGFAGGFVLTGLFFPLSGEGPRIAAGMALMFLSALGVCLFRRPPPESWQGPSPCN